MSGTGRSSAQVGIGDKRINFIQTDLLLSKEARRPEGFNQGLARFAYPKVSHKGIPLYPKVYPLGRIYPLGPVTATHML